MKKLILALALCVAAPVAGAQHKGCSPIGQPQLDSAGNLRDYEFNCVAAVVGTHPILWSEVLEAVNQRRASGLQVPSDSAGAVGLARQVLSDLIDEEVLIQKATDEKVTITDDELRAGVDRQYNRVKGQFKTEAVFRAALKQEGFGSPDEYRRTLTDQARRSGLQQRVIDKLRTDGKLVSAVVSEADVEAAYQKNVASLPRRPAQITFRQIVVKPKPTAAAQAAARAKADSILVELGKGGDFEQIAKRVSMDPGTKDLGGDLGWNRRGVMVPEFDRWMFALNPGQTSPVVETTFGYHIIRVERVQPAEVKARHILISPKLDSSDVARAHLEADSVAIAWRAGTSYDTLAARHHDPIEEKSILEPFPEDSLPKAYQDAFRGKAGGTIVDPFPIADPRSGLSKWVVAQIVSRKEGGEYTIADMRQTFREQLGQERSIRRLLDSLRKDIYISIRI